MKKRGRKILKIILLVVILLVLAGGIYFGIQWRGQRNLEIFQQGVSFGYTQAVLEVINFSDSCEPFPVYAGNETRTLISLDCLT